MRLFHRALTIATSLGSSGFLAACGGAPDCEATRTCSPTPTTEVTAGGAGAAGAAPGATPPAGAGGADTNDPRSCRPGTADCNGDPTDGCEVDIDSNTSHCGGCGFSCSPDNADEVSCVAGTCQPTCSDGFADCTRPDGPDDGCETDIATDPDHCGACGHACSGTGADVVACEAGSCAPTCSAGFVDCTTPEPPFPDDGCTDVLRDPLHCGGCGFECGVSHTKAIACDAGTCSPSCADGWGDCSTPADVDDGCETNLATSTDHCGACGHGCSAEGADAVACTSGSCEPTCTAVRGDCSTPPTGSPDDGCETDLQNDPTRCGSCGHDCLGGACEGATCQPRVLASVGGPIRDLAFTEGHLVYNAGAGIGRVDPDDGSAQNLRAATTGRRVAAAGSSAYYMHDRNLMCVRLDTGTETLLRSGLPRLDSNELEADDHHVYWASGTIARVSTTGGGLETFADSAGIDVRQDEDRVFWVSPTGVFARPKIGGATTILDTRPGEDLAVSGDAVFYSVGHRLYWASASSPNPRLFGTDPSSTAQFVDLVADGQVVWATTIDQGIPHLRRFQAGQSAPDLLASGSAPNFHLAEDEVALYWGGADGTIHKLAKD